MFPKTGFQFCKRKKHYYSFTTTNNLLWNTIPMMNQFLFNKKSQSYWITVNFSGDSAVFGGYRLVLLLHYSSQCLSKPTLLHLDLRTSGKNKNTGNGCNIGVEHTHYLPNIFSGKLPEGKISLVPPCWSCLTIFEVSCCEIRVLHRMGLLPSVEAR